MNCISRIYPVLFQLEQLKDETLFKAFKSVFKATNDIMVYKALVIFDVELKDIEENYLADFFFNHPSEKEAITRVISLFRNHLFFQNQVKSHLEDIKTARLLLSISSKLVPHENIKPKLQEASAMIDDFLTLIDTLDISEVDKFLYLKVTNQLQESLSFYAITGTKGIISPLKAFECLTRDTKEAKSIVTLVSEIITISGGLIAITHSAVSLF